MAISDSLAHLKRHADATKVRGRFLLSTAEPSDFWLDINEFVRIDTVGWIQSALSVLLGNIVRTHGDLTIVLPSHTHLSERSFPLSLLLAGSTHLLDSRLANRITVIPATSDHLAEHITVPRLANNMTILFMAMSTHVSILERTITAIRSDGAEVSFVVTLVSRELTSLSKMTEANVVTIPLLIMDSRTAAVFTLCDFRQVPGQSYRYLREYEELWKD